MPLPVNFMPILGEAKFIVGIAGVLWSVFVGFNYVKTALSDTQKGVKAIQTELTTQTTAIVTATNAQTTELHELRTDVGRLVQSMMTPPPRARAARAARRKK